MKNTSGDVKGMGKTLRLLGTVNTHCSPALVGAADLLELLDRFMGQNVRVTISSNQSGLAGLLRLEGRAQPAGATVLVGGADLGKALAQFHDTSVNITVSALQDPRPRSQAARADTAFAMWMRRCIAYAYTPDRMLETCPPLLRQKAGV